MGMESLLVFLLLCVASSAVSSPLLPILAGDGKPSAYEVLETYNFPVGLLPKGCLGYDLDQATGTFSAYFDGACGFSLEGSYQLHYESTISGRISNGRFSDLRGVSVKILFFWVNIIEVTRDGDRLQFSVGIASAGFPIGNFYESPQCGCGLVCHPTSYDLLIQILERSLFSFCSNPRERSYAVIKYLVDVRWTATTANLVWWSSTLRRVSPTFRLL